MQLWDRERVDRLKATAAVRPEEGFVLLAPSSPADSLQAATELGYPHFSHLYGGYPVYAREERSR